VFVLATINRSFVREKTERLAEGHLLASAEILKAAVRDLLEENVPAGRVLQGFEGAEEIFFMAVLDARLEVLDWASRFEGYLPFSRQDIPQKETWIIDSPAGRIFNVVKPFTTSGGTSYFLYLGTSLGGLEDMLARSRRNSWLIFGVLAAAGLLLFGGVFRLHRQSLERAEEAIAERKEKERLKEISGFTAGIAHEVKNPLNSLALLHEMMSRNAPPELTGDLALGQAEVRKIAAIIDSFSDAAKPLSPRRIPLRLAAVADEVRSALLPQAEAKGLSLLVEDRERTVASVDRGLLAQALLNLVRNAVEATDRGGVKIEIVRKKGAAVIRIEDTGRGIPAGIADRLFEPFATSKPDGLGVGLFLARKIVAAHDGTLTASARPGGGAVFTIELPGGRP
jgi:signal transduction histidine kinase